VDADLAKESTTDTSRSAWEPPQRRLTLNGRLVMLSITKSCLDQPSSLKRNLLLKSQRLLQSLKMSSTRQLQIPKGPARSTRPLLILPH
jgi:hypothetical protein